MKLVFPDGTEFKLPDISYDKFVETLFKEGSSDTEYEKYLRENNMHELTSFNYEALKEAILVVSDSEKTLKFKCFYNSDYD